MGGGVSGMFETILVTLLVASLCGLICAYGGFESILAFIRRVFRSKRGGQLGIPLLFLLCLSSLLFILFDKK